MRRLVLILLVAAFAFGLVSQIGGEPEPAYAASTVRGPNQIFGKPLYRQARVERYARSVGATRYIKKTIPIYYRLAKKRNIAPDVLVAQAMIETGYGRYGGDSRPWNMAGIKKGGIVGDAPKDFERPKTPYGGARMHVNHMAAYMGKKPIQRLS